MFNFDDYVIIKVVAAAPYTPGRHRVKYTACLAYVYGTDKPKKWVDKDLAEIVEQKRDGIHKAQAIRCNKDTWVKAKAGEMNGWTTESSLETPVTIGSTDLYAKEV